ncbi:Hypothetical protein HVR_LOCUS1099 [uncultured virus]|nr:Hypothetical protein HVR_LOCUS1099 [uncultured virus]
MATTKHTHMMTNLNEVIPPRNNLLDTPEKQRLRHYISEILTQDVKNECPGLTILVLSREEYEIMMDALKEKANRMRKQNIINKPTKLTLNVVRQ